MNKGEVARIGAEGGNGNWSLLFTLNGGRNMGRVLVGRLVISPPGVALTPKLGSSPHPSLPFPLRTPRLLKHNVCMFHMSPHHPFYAVLADMEYYIVYFTIGLSFDVFILHWLSETTLVYYCWRSKMKCWLRMPSEMSRIHLSPPTIEIEKKLTEFISIEIIRNC